MRFVTDGSIEVLGRPKRAAATSILFACFAVNDFQECVIAESE